MKAQIKNQDADYLRTMIEDLYSVRVAKQIKFTEGDFHTTVEYVGIERVENTISSLVADLNNEAVPAFKTRGEEMLAELAEINKDLAESTLKIKMKFEVKQALRNALALAYETNDIHKFRLTLTNKINNL